MRSAFQDVRFACRLLVRDSGFTALAVVVLALGIGANAAIFSVVDRALLRPLPFPQADQLAVLWERPPAATRNRVAPLNFQDWHDQNTAFSSMAAVAGGSRTLQTADGAEQIPGQAVTSEFFRVMGVNPVAGRSFTEEDARSGAAVVMITERMWRTRFGGDPHLVGGTLQLDGKPYLVTGVVPDGFQILWRSDLWTLYTVKRSPEQRRMHYLAVIGRMKPGITVERAGSSMAPVADHIASIAPDTNRGWGITVEPLRAAVVGSELRTTMLVLAGVVALVLLMACANVANLMLARGEGRKREMAVRVSLGAGASRLVRQLLTESLLLAMLGGAGGLLAAWLLVASAPSLIPADTLPVGLKLALDARATAFVAAITLATGLLMGLAPAWQVARRSLAGILRGGGRTVSSSSKVLPSLATVEIAIAVMVVAGAGLFVRTLERIGREDPGFHAERVLTMKMILPLNRYQTQDRALRFYEAAQREIESLPGVREAAFGGSLPLAGFEIGQGFQVVGASADSHGSGTAHYQIVGPKYFDTLGIPLRAGRAFTEHDGSGSAQVAIVNQEFVRRYLPGKPAVGTHLRVQGMDMSGPKFVEREIVGVIGQVKVDGLAEPENVVEVYVPIAQNPWFGASLAVRTQTDPLAMAAAVKSAIAKVDPSLAVTQVRTMDQMTYESAAQPRFRARLVGGFAGLALVLAAVGIFGVLAFAVKQRTREFGIRMALGAQVGDVLWMVLSGGARMAAAGVTAGLVGAAVLARSLAALLFGVKPLDPASFLVSAGVLLVVAITAAAIPALRAARVDPAIALRDD